MFAEDAISADTTEGKAEDAAASGNQETGVLNHYEYDAFGNTLACEETVANRFRFTGEIYDAVTAQYYLRARFYNPVLGRFMQEDDRYTDGLNLYAYCKNNPVRYTDPSGHNVTSGPDRENDVPDDTDSFYEDMYDNQRETIPEYEDYLDAIREAQAEAAADAQMSTKPDEVTPSEGGHSTLEPQQQSVYDAARARGLTAAEAYYIATGKNPLNKTGSDYMVRREQNIIMNYYQESVNRNFNRYKGTRTSQQVGTWTHSAVANDMNNNFIVIQMRDLPYIREIKIEQNYLGGNEITSNMRGSSRVDILIINNVNNNIHIGDIKTGNARYGMTQRNRNEANIAGTNNPNGYTFTHQQIKPN